MQSELAKSLDENAELRKEVSKLRDDREQAEGQDERSQMEEAASNSEWTSLFSSNNANNGRKSQMEFNILDASVNEAKQRERREKNLLIFGFARPAEGDETAKAKGDEESVKKVFNHIGIKEMLKRVIRIGKKDKSSWKRKKAKTSCLKQQKSSNPTR
jgi:hypothetical protein